MNALVRELLRTGLYKRSQGRICRQVTFAVIVVLIAWGLHSLSGRVANLKMLPQGWELPIQYGLIGLLAAAGAWFAYRIVNLPAFADFLIAVEAEMNKVSWPTRSELFRGSAVVVVLLVALALVLYGFDMFWIIVFRGLGIV